MKEEDKRKRKVTAFKPSTTVSERSKTYRTTYIDEGGNIVTTVHDGNFNPYPTPPTPTADYLYFEANAANSTVSMTSTLATAPNLEYSTDGSTFQEWQHTTSEGTHTFDIITLGAVGDKVYFRGTNAALSNIAQSEMSNFAFTGNIKAGGTVQSLVDNTGESATAIEMAALFHDALETAALTEVESTLLTATIMVDNCYIEMFVGQTALAAPPALPAATMVGGSHAMMFYNTTFNTSTDGTTFNFDVEAANHLPQTVTAMGQTMTITTAKELATFMGNDNGFNE